MLDALAGKNVAEAVRLDAQSIEDAKRTLEEANIDEMLGAAGSAAEYVGPRAPKLPPLARSMNAHDFTLAALDLAGARIIKEGPGIYFIEGKDVRERICFGERPDDERRLVLYAPHTPPFQRLVKRTVSSGIHNVKDGDLEPGAESNKLATQWAENIGAILCQTKVVSVTRAFYGTALLRVRATVAHDSYEQLVECPCQPEYHRQTTAGDNALGAIERIIRDSTVLGINHVKLREAGERDEAIAEFARFYEERREQEMEAAGNDARKRKKLEDDFTPRFDMVLAGLEGEVCRDVAVRVCYSYADGGEYESEINVRPGTSRFLRTPETDLCAKSGRYAPRECLGECEVSGAKVLKHLLVTSEFSNRLAQPEFIERCELSGKSALVDELEESAVTGRRVASVLLKHSAVSDLRAEPEHFGVCAFTKAEILRSELSLSEISGKAFRADQIAHSAVSGKAGHVREFITCYETHQTIARTEAETCDVSGQLVRPGVLETCAVTGKRALPSLLATCQATGVRVLRDHLITSSVSNVLLLQDKAVKSSAGRYCLPTEAETCFWSGRELHPDDLRTCVLTGLRVHAEYVTPDSRPRLRPLAEMLDGLRHNTDESEIWDRVSQSLARVLKRGTCRIESATLSPSKQRLATCAESKTMLGLRVHQVGCVYDLTDDVIVGRLAEGKRSGNGWVAR